MRRALAITLLIAFFAPFAAPPLAALTADPEANLPPCCRSHGAHHCAMLHWMLQHADSGAPSIAPAPCSRYPGAAAVPQLATFTLTASPQLAAAFRRASAPAAASPRAAHLSTARAHQTRGPPAPAA